MGLHDDQVGVEPFRRGRDAAGRLPAQHQRRGGNPRRLQRPFPLPLGLLGFTHGHLQQLRGGPRQQPAGQGRAPAGAAQGGHHREQHDLRAADGRQAPGDLQRPPVLGPFVEGHQEGAAVEAGVEAAPTRVHRQHRRGAAQDQPLRHASPQGPAHPAPPVGAEHDQVGSRLAVVGRQPAHHVPHLLGVDVRLDADARGEEPPPRPLQVTLRLGRRPQVRLPVHGRRGVVLQHVEQGDYRFQLPGQVGGHREGRLRGAGTVQGHQQVAEHGYPPLASCTAGTG